MTDVYQIHGWRNATQTWHFYNTHRGDEEGAKRLAKKLMRMTSYDGVKWVKQ